MLYRAEIEMRLPSLNTYINVCRTNKFQAASFKRKYESEIGYFLQGIPTIEKPVIIHFHWIEPNRRRDLDNIAFGKKFILDAMVKKGILIDDSARFVKGFSDTFELGKTAKIVVTLQEVEND